MTTATFFDQLWQHYVEIAPSALKIRALLEECGEVWINDHVAFRTFDCSPMALADLESHLLAFGYKRFEPYRFEDKFLNAFGYLHSDRAFPRVFLSELETRRLSPEAQEMIDGLVNQVDPKVLREPSCLFAGPLWELPSEADYKGLLSESEYAGWLSVNGLCANHFTVSVNALEGLEDLDALMSFLEQAGFRMNLAGGRIKGTPEVKLVQGSTLADRIVVTPREGQPYEVTTCYVEFAQRFDGFDGFVPKSADKIFESTNRG